VADLLTVDDALARVLDHVSPLPSELVSIDDSLGRVLAEPAHALVDLPPFPSSAMDGFAVRAVDTPGELPVAFRVAAGAVPSGALPTGCAAGIATGGAVPDDADAVIPVEVVEDRGETVVLPQAVSGQHVRPRGGDVGAGDVVVEGGLRVTAVRVGALAAAGVAAVTCSRRPRVAVLATGSELRNPGESLEPGQIYESNRRMVAAALEGCGALTELLPVAADEVAAHRTALERALLADVVVTSGGVSMGPHDLVRRVAADLGVEEVFWGVAIKPGKPLAFGVRGSTLVFGLPGNPVSSLVGALVFVRTALLALQGLRDPLPAYASGRVASSLRRNPHRDEFVRARSRRADGERVLEPVTGQESHMIVRASTADTLIHVPRGEDEIAAGDTVQFLELT
jgi:molybdopterin molybdotransferase